MLLPEILAIVFLSLGPIYVLLRIFNRFPVRDKNVEIKPTTSGKLHHSKVNDAAFFDGMSEDYAEAMNRMKQLGGA